MHRKVEAIACRDWEMNTMFIAAMAIPVPKYIYGQYFYEQENAGTKWWKFWGVQDLENKYCIYSCSIFVYSQIC